MTRHAMSGFATENNILESKRLELWVFATRGKGKVPPGCLLAEPVT